MVRVLYGSPHPPAVGTSPTPLDSAHLGEIVGEPTTKRRYINAKKKGGSGKTQGKSD